MLFIVRKLIFYPFKFLRSGNTIARAERIWIKPISDYKMGYLSLAYRKVFGGAGTFLPKKVLQIASPPNQKLKYSHKFHLTFREMVI